MLAMGTNMRAPPGDLCFYDNSAAAGARVAFAPKDASERQVAAALSGGVHIITVGRAAFFDT